MKHIDYSFSVTGDYTTRKQRITRTKRKAKRSKTVWERWSDGKVYLHLAFLPFKLRVK